ncbi:hypothetical protein [Pseudomonas sp. RW405]|uniref:hypothetical protein n=1 Tax=Pseudomonas sp. RW405 TaxID=2202652 RepID=UPI000D72B6C3|nr:hypothetical protein [Pseudomonas sp. RW405]PWY45286.1 hypothetical protein DK184_11600 [Pseudomonas sp. RW405]
MTMPEMVATGTLVAMVIILLVLMQQALRLGELGKKVELCQRDLRWLQIWEMENRELRSALRAEREHVAQLRRKLDLLQALVPVTD